MAAAVQQYPNSGLSMTIDAAGWSSRFRRRSFSPAARIKLPRNFRCSRRWSRRWRCSPTLQIDGFTDSVPITTPRFHDNWDLSAARASSVLRYTLAHTSISPDHLAIAGYGPYQPIGDNATEDGRALNRRVEVIVKPGASKA